MYSSSKSLLAINIIKPDKYGYNNIFQEAMRKMTEEDKQKIAQQVELFRREKLTFDSEVAKWDDTGNDIIFLAKHMCMIMMEMTDFTRLVPLDKIFILPFFD